jgi:hypothetical protein
METSKVAETALCSLFRLVGIFYHSKNDAVPLSRVVVDSFNDLLGFSPAFNRFQGTHSRQIVGGVRNKNTGSALDVRRSATRAPCFSFPRDDCSQFL